MHRQSPSVHFIGIGGIGMSAIAEVLIQLGFEVSGSDLSESSNTQRLVSLGAEVHIGHSSENVKNVSFVVFSSAINKSNPEVVAAKELDLPVLRRAEMLAELMRLKKGVAVAGTHGKTTTTSIVSTLLENGGLDPTYVIGGIVKNLGGHAKVGKGEWLVAEADESDGSFLNLNPIISVITNIDLDHMDFYKSEDELKRAFVDFGNRTPFFGCCLMNAHDERSMEIRSQIKRATKLFGIEGSDHAIDYMAKDIEFSEEGAKFKVAYNGEIIGGFETSISGRHNVLNAVAAIGTAYEVGLGFDKIQSALRAFKGVGRRFQSIYKNNNLEIVDDYAHHPTEIRAVIDAAKSTRKNKKIIVVFEPHRYTRTRDCWDEYLRCFSAADQVWLCPIYPAGEKEINGVSSEKLAQEIASPGNSEFFCKCLGKTEEMDTVFSENKSQNTIVLVMGAGSIGKKAQSIVSAENF